MKKIVAILIFFMLHCVHLFAQDGKVFMNIDYAGDGKIYHRLDIYRPVKIPLTEKIPPVLLIYGSAFFGNNMKDTAYKIMAAELLNKGFAVVPINHRASTDSVFPAQVHDVKAAVRFIRANADTFGLDSSFIAIAGYSSGGYLSAMAGVTSGTQIFEGNVGHFLNISSSVQAVGDWFGPTDFLVMDSCGSSMKHNDSKSPESVLIGGPIQQNKQKVKAANPITYVSKNTPPFFIAHGTADELVPFCQSELLLMALQKKNIRTEFKKVENGGHGPGVFSANNFKLMADFFKYQQQHQK